MSNINLKEEVARLHANMCHGIADTNRILLIYALADGPQCVNDLAGRLELPQPTVSRHLKIMRECGIVQASREGQSVHYSLIDLRVIQALDLLRSVMSDTLEGRAALTRESGAATGANLNA